VVANEAMAERVGDSHTVVAIFSRTTLDPYLRGTVDPSRRTHLRSSTISANHVPQTRVECVAAETSAAVLTVHQIEH
jgi:hypothetical protein